LIRGMIISGFERLYALVFASPAKRDKIFLVNFFAAAAINVALWVINIWLAIRVGEFVILRYNIYFGISSLGHWHNLLWFPLAGLLIIVANFGLAFYFYLRQRILSYFLVCGAGLFNLLILVMSLFLIYINF
jgi:hypothetical protein